MVVQFIFLNFANLICRGMDISKYFRESLGIRDNESQLYLDAPHICSFDMDVGQLCVFQIQFEQFISVQML